MAGASGAQGDGRVHCATSARTQFSRWTTGFSAYLTQFPGQQGGKFITADPVDLGLPQGPRHDGGHPEQHGISTPWPQLSLTPLKLSFIEQTSQ